MLPCLFAMLQDDVPEEVKQRRLAELIAAYRQQLHLRSAAEVGRRHLVLVEGPSRRSGGCCQRLAAIWGRQGGRLCGGKGVLRRLP